MISGPYVAAVISSLMLLGAHLRSRLAARQDEPSGPDLYIGLMDKF